jgi:hypothetical protein
MFGDVGMTQLSALENGGATAAVAPATGVAPGRTAGLLRLLPSFTDVAFLAPLLVLYARLGGATTMLGDGDTGWHLRTGEWILTNGRIPDRDIFSYTKAGEPWFAWEWLWDLVFGWLHLHWGMAGVIFASTLVISLTFALVYRLALRRSGHPVLAIAVTLVAGFGSSIHWLARPHLLTLLLVVVFYALLERAQEGRMRALLWLPPLTVVWTNLHGGFVAGLVIVGMYAAGEAMSWLVETRPDARALARGRAWRYLACAGACLAASLANPYGYHLHAHILHYVTDSFQLNTINEFLSLNFRHPIGKYMEAMMLLAGVTAVWNITRRRFTYAIVLVVWMHMALVSVRHLPIFVILAAPLVSECLADLAGRLSRAEVAGWLRRLAQGLERMGAETMTLERIGRIPLVPVAAALLLLVLLRAEATPAFRAQYDAKHYPVRAAEMMRGQRGVMTIDIWGGYLIYRLYPDFKVFIDGRSDFYGAEFDQRYLGVLNGRYDWQKTLDENRVEAVLLPVEASLVSTLKESARWRPVYDDGVAILFRRSAPGALAAGETTQHSAVENSGFRAATKPQTTQPVILGSQSYARR